MNVVDKIRIAQMRGVNVQLYGNKLGPYAITPETLLVGLKELYRLLQDVGCTYSGGELNYNRDVDRLNQGLGAIATDDPVSVALAPRMRGHKWEYHPAKRLLGWPELDRHSSDIKDTSDLLLVDVTAIDGIEIYITGVKGKRVKTVEAAVRRVLTGT